MSVIFTLYWHNNNGANKYREFCAVVGSRETSMLPLIYMNKHSTVLTITDFCFKGKNKTFMLYLKSNGHVVFLAIVAFVKHFNVSF